MEPPSASDQQNNPPSVVGTLYTEHERTTRFQDNLAKRPRDCDPNASFETKWAFTAAESKRADVEKKTSNQLSSATMTISFAMHEVKEEITEIDSLLRGINVREHELESMTHSLDKMCLTLAARNIDRKKLAEAPSASGEHVAKLDTDGGGGCPEEDVDMKTASRCETTLTGPSSNVSTADEISSAEHHPVPPGTTVLGQQSLDAAPSSHHYAHDASPCKAPVTARSPSHFDNNNNNSVHHHQPHATSPHNEARSPSHFDYSALSAYTPLQQRTPHKMDSTITCPRNRSSKSRSSSRSRSERERA